MNRKKRIGYVLITLLVTLACVPILPAVAPLPTQPVGAVDTIVAATYGAARSATALVRSQYTSTPTLPPTFTPSHTPSITPSATATFILSFPIRTNTPTPKKTSTPKPTSASGGGGGGGGGSTDSYVCRVIGVSPPLGAVKAPGALFTATWRVKNVGNVRWDHNSVDYLFRSGAHLHLQAIYDLPVDVPVNDVVDLQVAMQAPAAPGTYTTLWIMHVGQTYFCSLKVTIKVQ